MEKTRVMHLHIGNKIYGAEAIVFSLLKNISRKNICLSLACLCLEKDNPEFINAARAIPDLEVIPIYMRHKYDISAIKGLRLLLRKHNIQILHTHGYKTDIIGFIASSFLRTKIVSTLHGWVDTDLKLKFNNFLDRQVLRFFDKVVAVSGKLESETTAYINRDKVACIKNAIDFERLNKIEPLDLKEAFGIDKGLRVVVYVGRLAQEKGVEDLMQAASLLLKNDAKTVFIFVGDGYLEKSLKEISLKSGIEKKVYFTGYREDALSILQASDLFVLPSLTEGLSRSAMEAMGLGTLILATKVGGMPELIEDGKNGFLLAPQQPKLLAEKMELILRDKDTLGPIRAKAQETIREKFSVERMCREYEGLYGELAEEG